MQPSTANLTSLQTSKVLFYYRRLKDVDLLELEKRALKVCEVPNLASRKREVIFAKSLIYHELYSKGYSLCEIGRIFRCNHSSVHNLLSKYDDRLKYDKEFKMLVDKFNNYGNQNES